MTTTPTPFRSIAAARPTSHRQREEESPFLPLGQLVRVGFLYYLFAYRLFFPIVGILLSDGSKDLLGPRIIAEVFYTCLLAYPFIFYRKEYGWLHPLVLPTVYELAKSVGKSPFSLVMPFEYPVVSFTVETISPAAVLAIPNYELAWTRLQLTLLSCYAQSIYLIAFLFGPTFRVPLIHTRERPPNLVLSAMLVIGGLMATASIFIIAKGGITEVLIGMRGGRRALFEGSGHLVLAGTMAPLIAVLWFGSEKNPWRNPVFLGGLSAALLTAILVSGSRSSMIMPVLSIILIWWWKRGRALILPTIMAGIFALFVIGSFGAIRQDYGSTTIDLSVLDPTNFGSTMSRALEDIEGRHEKEEVLAVVAGANQNGLLWGRSYINAATFWIPRALWKDKPVGTDVYNMWLNFNGNPIGDKPPPIGAWGIPVSAETEAYWNLGLFGVTLLFTVLGIFHATLAKAAYIYRHVALFWIVYINCVMNMSGTAKEFINLIVSTSVLVGFALFAGFFSGAKANERFLTRRLKVQT